MIAENVKSEQLEKAAPIFQCTVIESCISERFINAGSKASSLLSAQKSLAFRSASVASGTASSHFWSAATSATLNLPSEFTSKQRATQKTMWNRDFGANRF